MWHKARTQRSQGVAGWPCVGVSPKTIFSTCLGEAVLKVSNAQRRCKEKTWPLGQVAWTVSYPIPRKRERSLHTCAQNVQITRIVTI
jgi:hypothetical protein